MSTRGNYRIASNSALLAVLLLATLFVGGCGLGAGSQPQCSGGNQPYKETCLSQVTIEYLTCTENRGFDVTKEVITSAGGSFKAVADASLSVAYKEAKQENTPVALEIVKTCSELAKRSEAASNPERAALSEFQRQADDSLKKFEQESLDRTASIKLSKTSARIGDKITVEGTQFQADETVDIEVDLHQVARVTANAQGSFSATITIPDDVVVRAPSHNVSAHGRTSARADSLPIKIQ